MVHKEPVVPTLSKWPVLLNSCEMLFPTYEYDINLGMRSYAAVLKQLAVDLPRSCVLVNGRRTENPLDVLKQTRWPRMCTQAVFAPPLEWLLHEGYSIFEPKLPRSPMYACVDSGTVRARKRVDLFKGDVKVASADITISSAEHTILSVNIT